MINGRKALESCGFRLEMSNSDLGQEDQGRFLDGELKEKWDLPGEKKRMTQSRVFQSNEGTL